ncbi:MAG: hypothetical protein HQ480_00205 [Candidatus Pelagibacter sp.]|nr:hypothetical protein [Candidatus Pelagibacter sp.]
MVVILGTINPLALAVMSKMADPSGEAVPMPTCAWVAVAASNKVSITR